MHIILFPRAHVKLHVPAPEAALRTWRPGLPAIITEMVAKIDREICRCLRCPACRRRGMDHVPETDGVHYRFRARCGRCGHVLVDLEVP